MGRLLAQAELPIALVAARKLAAAERAVRFIGSGQPVGLSDPRLLHASIFLVTVSDAAITTVARDLAGLGTEQNAWRGKVILHTCGSLPATALSPLQRRGGAVGSLHPFQTVPSPQAGVRNLRGCFWALEGDRTALRVARAWVKRLEGVSFHVAPEQKTIYHLSAFLVGPSVATLISESMALLRQAGVPARISRVMLRQFVVETAKNFADLGPRRALTGPAVRGDWVTIRRHLAAISRAAPALRPVYRSLLEAMLRLARKSPRQAAGKYR